MPQKIAVAIIHGVGKPNPNFSDGIAQELRDRFAKRVGKRGADPASALVIRPVYWAPVLQNTEEELCRRLKRGGEQVFAQTLGKLAVDAGEKAPLCGK